MWAIAGPFGLLIGSILRCFIADLMEGLHNLEENIVEEALRPHQVAPGLTEPPMLASLLGSEHCV